MALLKRSVPRARRRPWGRFQGFLRVAGGLLSLLAAFHAPPLSAAERPNVILVMTDDQGYPPIGRHGHPWIRTPNLDRLYDRSTRFTRFLVNPTCSPTRSAILTGRHAMRNGVTHTYLERERMALDATTLPQALKAAGYISGVFGKWHLGDEDAYQPRQRGFDESFIHGGGILGQSHECSCGDAPNNSYFDPVIRHNGTFVKTHGFCTDVFFSAALDWMDRQSRGSKPFFALITPNAPHDPYQAPERWQERFLKAGCGANQAGFYGMIENIDHNMGRLDAFLSRKDLYAGTIVIFMSDNGMTPGGSGKPETILGTDPAGQPLPFFNAGMKGLKGSTDEGSVRVPFLVRADGRFPPNRDVDRIAGDIDVFPTLAALTGAPLPDGQIEGRNLVPLLENPAAEWKDRLLFTHLGRWATGQEPNDFQWKTFSVRSQRFRFVNNDQLFDMDADPGQTTNVIDRHPQVADDMRKAWAAWWAETRPLMVNETVPLSPVRPYHERYEQQLRSEGIPDWKPVLAGAE